MCIGFRAFLDFERPDSELVESYRGIPSANIGDCVRKMTCMFDGIRSFNKKPLVGTAFTVKVPSGDNLVAQMALDYAKPGDIIVVDGAGYTDRALVDIKNSPLPVFAKAVTPLGPYRDGPGEVNVPVVCGGQVVMPGDILVGDIDGIVVVPRKDAAKLLNDVHKNLEQEQREIKQMLEGTYTEEEHQEIFTGQFLKRGGSLEKASY